MPADEGDTPQERLQHEAEELMRQRRFRDAAARYGDLRQQSPTDLWASLGHVSALECAGDIDSAERVLEQIADNHRRSAPMHRFRHLFFVRREDFARASHSQAALHQLADEGPEDQLADLYFNQGRYHEARAELERIQRDGLPEDPEVRASVLARHGACLRQEGDLADARRKLLEALALEPKNHWALSELAEAERALGEPEAARRHYREALELQPNDHWTRGHLAQLEHEQGERDRAIALYEEIIHSEPRSSWALVELAQITAERDPARAAALCRQALEYDPDYPWAHAHLGQLARRSGDLEEARAHLQRASAGSPNALWILHELADVSRQLGRWEEARAHLDHARAIDPYDATTYGYLGDLLRGQGRSDEARTHLEKAVDLDPAYAWAWRELAELRGLAGRHDEADEAANRAAAVDGDAPASDGLRAFLLRLRGRRDAAVPWLERAIEHDPGYLFAWRELADAHLAAGRLAEAEDTARRGLAQIADAGALHAALAEALRRQGRRADALAAVEAGLAKAPRHAPLLAMRAELAAEAGDLATAREALDRARELDKAPELALLDAQLLATAGKDAEAATALAPLLAGDGAPAAVHDLAAALAERRGDLPAARTATDRGLEQWPQEPRLLLRRARLGRLLGESEPTARLAPLLAAHPAAPGPWRECSHEFAAAGDGHAARAMAHRWLTAARARLAGAGDGPTAAPARADLARAWLSLAEIELQLGEHADADTAQREAIAADPTLAQARLLGAVLAEQRDDLPAAIAQLRELESAGIESGDGEQAIGRQLAILCERSGKSDEALMRWRALAAVASETPKRHLRALELAAHLCRRGDPDAGAATARGHVEAAPDDATELQRWFRDHALARAEQAGAEAGLRVLEDAGSRCAAANLVLRTQLALAAGLPKRAEAAIDIAERVTGSDAQVLALLRVRCLLASERLGEAERAANAARVGHETDEEPAVLLAEALAHQRRHVEALAILRDPALPARWSVERSLLAACAALDLGDLPAAAAALGHAPAVEDAPPLLRLAAAAWPGIVPAPAGRGISADDLTAVPPWPGLARHLAAALATAGHRDHAAALCAAVARVRSARGDQDAARRLAAEAARHLRSTGQLRRARAEAWRFGAWGAWFRSWMR